MVAACLELIDHSGIKIPEASMRVHGISNEDVIGQGSFSMHARDIAELIDGADSHWRHNVNGFDWRFIEFEFMRIRRLCQDPMLLLTLLS